MTEAKLEAWLEETRSFAPSAAFSKQANAQPGIYAEACLLFLIISGGLGYIRHTNLPVRRGF